jgi:hypothetical protein
VSQTSSPWAGSPTSVTYTGEIFYGTPKVDACISQKSISYSSSNDTPDLSLGVPVLQLSKSSRSSFSFTFTVGKTSRQIWSGTQFVFNLGWLGDNLAGVATNLHCFIRSGSVVTFGFSSLDITTSPSQPILTAGSDLPIGSYSYVCNGARSPALTSTTKMTFLWKPSSGANLASIEEASTSAIASTAVTMLNAQAVLQASLKSKLWNTPGSEASYTFLLKPKRANYTLNSRIYVDFTIDSPPRGNENGIPSCEINSTRVYCEWAHERRLVVWPVTQLTTSLTTELQYSYELTVHGVSQPIALGTFKNIGITLDLDSDSKNGVSE